MPYIYMDLMKQAIPGDYVKDDDNTDPDMQFAVFGTYDWLHCKVEDDFPMTIWNLKEEHENRHSVCWNYERQPIFLYFCQKDAERVKQICDNRFSEFRSRPFVMTLLQVEKHSLCGLQLELDAFLEAFQVKAELAIKEANIDPNDIEMCVCWNLSGSDILILSRTKRLSIISEVISVLQKEGIRIHKENRDIDIPVFSFSSHCAFPCMRKTKVNATGTTNAVSNYVDRDAIKEWIQQDQNLTLISFVETSYQYDGIVYADNQYQVLFGERDYRLLLSKNNIDQVVDSIVDRLNDQTAEIGEKYRFRSSYLVPGIVVNKENSTEENAEIGADHCESQAENKNSNLTTSPGGLLRVEDAYAIFSELKERYVNIKTIVSRNPSVFGNAEPDTIHPLVQQIDHCINSLMGLLKYAMRLQATINQYDLYCYIKKLYGGLDHAVAKYEEKITELSTCITQDRIPDRMRRFVSNLVMQTMSFVSELQHLFSVLALSPHNYMETYSSSMRSLNAASKLWGAYCGLIEEIARCFQTEIHTENEKKLQKCTVMLSPYRERLSQNSQYLAQFAEEETLVLIQMNFALMFKPEMAVFMIAHECGHHFGDRCREARFQYMSKAFFSYVFETAFSPYQTAPIHLLVSVEDAQEDRKGELKKYLALANKADKNENDYRNLLEIHLLNSIDTSELEAMYCEWSDYLREEYNTIFGKLIDYSFKNFKESYNKTKDRDWKSKNYFGEALMDSYNNIECNVPFFFEYVLGSAARAISKTNHSFVEQLLKHDGDRNISFDLNQIAKITSFWADKRAINLNKKLIVNELKTQMHVASKHTVELFREIFADIFAVSILDMSLDDYKSIIHRFSDMYTPLLQNPITIRRIYVVFNVVFNTDESNDLESWINSPECLYADDVKQVALEQVHRIKMSITKQYICDYGRKCTETVRERINAIQESADGKNALNRIRSLYRQDAQFINSLWHFWKGAMTS